MIPYNSVGPAGHRLYLFKNINKGQEGRDE